MENYKKGKNVEEEMTQDTIPIDLPEKFLWMHVKGGTKVSNVVEFAEKAFESGEYRSVVWSGSGGGVPKTISCSEIMKRNYELHQITRLAYQKIDEYWDPVLNGLDPIIVTRQVPSIHIYLTLDEVDSKTEGYQKSNVPTTFWPEPASKQQKKNEDYAYKNKRSFNSSSRGSNQYRNKVENGGRPQAPSSSNGSTKNKAKQTREKGNTPKMSFQPQPGPSSHSQAASES